eukprot:gene2234-33716_t
MEAGAGGVAVEVQMMGEQLARQYTASGALTRFGSFGSHDGCSSRPESRNFSTPKMSTSAPLRPTSSILHTQQSSSISRATTLAQDSRLPLGRPAAQLGIEGQSNKNQARPQHMGSFTPTPTHPTRSTSSAEPPSAQELRPPPRAPARREMPHGTKPPRPRNYRLPLGPPSRAVGPKKKAKQKPKYRPNTWVPHPAVIMDPALLNQAGPGEVVDEIPLDEKGRPYPYVVFPKRTLHRLKHAFKMANFRVVNAKAREWNAPGTWELGRKDQLYRNMYNAARRVKGDSNFYVVPRFFILPREYEEFRTDFLMNPGRLYIQKDMLVQQYIHNPYTVNGYKLGHAQSTSATCFDHWGLKLHDGITRFAGLKYSNNSRLAKQCVQLAKTIPEQKNGESPR